MSRLEAWAQGHRKELLAGGAAGAVALGLYARKKKSGGASSPVMSNIGGGRTVIAPASYDSTASDLYNSIEPLIENLQRQISNLGQTPSTPATSVTPTPVTPTPAPGPSPVPAQPTPAPSAAPTPPLVPQTVAFAPAVAAPNVVGVAVPAATSGPDVIYQFPNPITGQSGNLAVGFGQYPFVYGGTQAQVDQLTGAAPAPTDTSGWGGIGTWNDPKYSW